MKFHQTKHNQQILWLTDIHLDRTTDEQRELLFDALAGIEYDLLVITGDISNSDQLCSHLMRIARACYPRPVYFVLGNHDYHGSRIYFVDWAVRKICSTIPNLHYLEGDQIINLGGSIGLMGHGGWADARAGYGLHSLVRSPDWNQIHDFQSLSAAQSYDLMRSLGQHSATTIRRKLPLAMSQYKEVILITHVPPWAEAVLYNEKRADPERMPHYVNLSMGLAVQSIIKAFPSRKLTVLAGHSHSPCEMHIAHNLRLCVGRATTGKPEIQDLFYL